MHPPARRDQDVNGGFQVLPLERRIEGIGEKNHLRAFHGAMRGLLRFEGIAAPFRQRPFGSEAEQLFA